MIKTTKILINELANYKNPRDKIKRLVQQKKLIPIIKGIYETNKTVSGYCLASIIYGPSYLSFDFALAYHGLIPEMVYVYTSACFNKRRIKEYHTKFGTFTYRDVPKSAYPYGIELKEEKGYSYQLATKEKALCDKLYTISPVKNLEEMRKLLFEDLRIDIEELKKVNKDEIYFYIDKYKSNNIRMLAKFLRSLK